jgi:hypothetical protein
MDFVNHYEEEKNNNTSTLNCTKHSENLFSKKKQNTHTRKRNNTAENCQQ